MKVLLGMSGGVDSSVSALLLQQAGYEVVGCTMLLYGNDMQNSKDAKELCKKLKIEHYDLDLRERFKEKVIDDFIDKYSKCITPNPCIECNRFLKFDAMYEFAKSKGIDYIATGHYAKVEYDEKYKAYVLKKSNNVKKDQSYVLAYINKSMLEKIKLPLANFETKDEIRKIASDNNFSVATKADSEDICFIADNNYKRFLEENSSLKPKEGNIITKDGEVLGKHSGLYKYTIGQRKGLNISYSEPLFVIGYNQAKNELIVGTKEDTYSESFIVEDYNSLLDIDIEDLKVKVKIRYSSVEAEAVLKKLEDGKIKVLLKEPAARITPGQTAAFYIDDVVVGGGKISV